MIQCLVAFFVAATVWRMNAEPHPVFGVIYMFTLTAGLSALAFSRVEHTDREAAWMGAFWIAFFGQLLF